MRTAFIASLMAAAATASAAVPVVGLETRVASTEEGGSVSFAFTNSKLFGQTWSDQSQWGDVVYLKVKVSGTASLTKDFRNVILVGTLATTGAVTTRSLRSVVDNKKEGPETVVIELLPHPSYQIDPARRKIVLTVND